MSGQPASRDETDVQATASREAPDAPAVEAGVPRELVPDSPGSTQSDGAARTARLGNGRRSMASTAYRPLIEQNWSLMAVVFGVAMILAASTELVLPRALTVLMAVAAIIIAALTPAAIRVERDWLANRIYRQILAALVVVLPMALFGIALSRWTDHSGSQWSNSIGMLVIVSTLASIILNQRIGSIVAAQLGLWGAVGVFIGGRGTYAALAAGLVVGIYAAVRQSRADAAAARRLRESERARLRAEEILSDYEQTGQGWFWETDRYGGLVYLSPTVARMLDRELSGFIGRPLSELFQHEGYRQESERALPFHLSARAAFSDLALRAAIEGEERWWSMSGRPLYDSQGQFVGFRGSGSDLTEQRRSEEQASRLARYDPLTGLANRHEMSQALEKILRASDRGRRACAVLLIDLDRFKQVNDTMGHPAGDVLLKQVADRLESVVGDQGRVGRQGGDEFQVIVAGKRSKVELAELAHVIINELSEPYLVEGHRVMIGASIGVAVAPVDGVTAEAIIRNADLALYAAKGSGRARHYFYDADLHTDAEERHRLEQDLRDALVNGGLDLHYQPVVHTVTERITGFEALLRWTHPVRGALSPAKFIPIAEDAGLIAPIGEWALRKACADLATWPEAVRVAVNVSPLQFANPSLPAIITSALAAAQVDPSRLELEITESVFLNDETGLDAMFAALKRIGVRLALDDFGTGYSSLGYLKKAPFDKIKIDQSFVRGATVTGSRNGAIIASIVSLAEALGMETTAEGVETIDELDLVRVLGCSHVQGYIYEKPLQVEEATRRLETGLSAVAQGPRVARARRHTVLRKAMLEREGEAGARQVTVRNISATGAMIEGLWNVAPGTVYTLAFSDTDRIEAIVRWCQGDRIGLEFTSSIEADQAERIGVISKNGLSGKFPGFLGNWTGILP